MTGDQVKDVIDRLNKDYEKIGLKVKNMTCYIRFINKDGDNAEPVTDKGDHIERIFNFQRTVEIPTGDQSRQNTIKNKQGKKSASQT